MPLNILIKNKYKLEELKRMIETSVYSGEIIRLDFLDIEAISKKEYKEIFSEISNNIDLLKKVKIIRASSGVMKSLYIAINKIDRKNKFETIISKK